MRIAHIKTVQPTRGLPWETLRRFVGQPRRLVDGSKVYLFRDIFEQGRLVTCQYAVPNGNGGKKWLPCAEGSAFSEVQPWRFRKASLNG